MDFLKLYLVRSMFSEMLFHNMSRPFHKVNPQKFRNTAESNKKNIISRLFKFSTQEFLCVITEEIGAYPITCH